MTKNSQANGEAGQARSHDLLHHDWDPDARIAIEAVFPEIDGGRFPIKRIVGDTVTVWADIFRDGHDVVAGRILYRPTDEPGWQAAPLKYFDNDRWTGSFTVDRVGRWDYRIEAWTDVFASWRRDVVKKIEAGQTLGLEIPEGMVLIQQAAETHAGDTDAAAALQPILDGQSSLIESLLSAPTLAAMEHWGPRRDVTRYPRILSVRVDREAARFGAWYEMMPRSQGTDPKRSATFADCARRLPDIAAMGFDTLYLLPIHPIGRVNRKGPNNALIAGPDDPGSPYAIGSSLGGHTAIDPDLGTREDFRALVDDCARRGLEVAMDFAVQCAPDHPWVSEHPDWFKWSADGMIKFAENPPKKYQDIVNVEFYGPHRAALWQALADIVLFWIDAGVRIFRVDNPHTKPLPFWEWLIATVQARRPDIIFLAEAFTRPKMMRRLAKAGFTMSYTYFTWRNSKAELTEYVTELATAECREYFRPNFFANTPDILPEILQSGLPGAFRIRLALAALLSGVYGIYNGFELCEGTAIPNSEDYLHSEKYQYKVWDWDRPGNIKPFISRINRARRGNTALQDWANVRFHDADGDRVLFFSKTAADRSHTIFAAVSLDPRDAAWTILHAPFVEFGIDAYGAETNDLMTDGKYWLGPDSRIELTPENPLLLLRYRHTRSG